MVNRIEFLKFVLVICLVDFDMLFNLHVHIHLHYTVKVVLVSGPGFVQYIIQLT